MPNNKGIISLTPTGPKNIDFNNSNLYSTLELEDLALTIALSSDSIFVGGAFNSIKTRPIGRLVELNKTGTIPTLTITENRFQLWRRCTATFSLSDGDNYDAYIGITTNTESVSSATTGTETLLIWGSQINRGQASTFAPYISTLHVPRTVKYNDTWISFNNSNIKAGTVPLTSTIYSALCSFNTQTPTVCSINITLSARSTFDSFSPWFTPHVVTNSLTGVFLQKMLTADFIGFPINYFDSFGRQFTDLSFLTEKYTTSPGLCFYGEGHTEVIKLSAKNQTGISSYYWTIGNEDTSFYDISAIDSINGLFQITVSSTIGNYPTIPYKLINK